MLSVFGNDTDDKTGPVMALIIVPEEPVLLDDLSARPVG